MQIEALLPEAGRLAVQRIRIEPAKILLELRCTDDAVLCPDCQCPARRGHSRYIRMINDLPWRGVPMVIQWQARRFFCDNPDCQRRIFAEQLPGLVARHGRNTVKMNQALVAIGLECGGEPGRRLTANLGITTSGDTLLRRVRATSPPGDLHPDTIGIDDFAFRKGQRYGTVIVDHQSHKVVDLLPERSSGSTSNWLATQPQVRVVTRDRSSLYANGITDANPQAVQVADRFHLHVNLRDALIRLLDRHHQEVTAATHAAATGQQPAEPVLADAQPQVCAINAMESATPSASEEAVVPTRQAQLSMDRRARRLARYEQVRQLRDRGVGVRAIARQMKLGRETVKRFVRAGSFPERAKTQRARCLDSYHQQLRQLYDSGIHSATELHRQLRSKGFTGSDYAVRRYIAAWRDPAERGRVSGPRPTAKPAKPVRVSSNRLSWLLLKDEIERDADEHKLIDQLLTTCKEIRVGVAMAREFKPALAEHRAEDLWAWTTRATQLEVPAEIRSFAEGLVRDAASVAPAVQLTWSNGRAEGHVNRIKLIKRKMYGRANFDLLRKRVLCGR